jgi:hypothetical protein
VNNLNRRRLFKIAGVGSALAASAALPVVGHYISESSGDSDVFAFRSTIGMPELPLPSYATYLVEGTLNLAAGTGLVTSRVLAGHPDDPSEIGLPGLARIIKVTQVQANGPLLNVQGIIEDRSQLQPGESPRVDLIIDRARRTIMAPFGGRSVTLALG